MKDGYYWVRGDKYDPKPYLVEVIRGDVYHTGSEEWGDVSQYDFLSGPLSPPSDTLG